MTHSADLTLVCLSPESWERLLELATRAVKKNLTGGWQDRLRRWCYQMDEETHSVWLSHAPHSQRALDDMTFVARAIAQRDIGGWQRHCHSIFVDCHPRFTGIAILPRKRKRP